MVTEEEIRQISKLMRIEIRDHAEYIEKVHSMIDYFDILDSAGVESEGIMLREMSLLNLRDDTHVPFDESLIDRLNHHRTGHVRAPRMT